jgi:hypothetical protein
MKYFAYGSNMLTERIKAPTRCISAQPVGAAFVTGYVVKFIKESIDESGKATLVNTGVESDIVHGVLFEIENSEDEIKRLDIAEGVSDGGYEVKTDLTVTCDSKFIDEVRTYIAPEEKCKKDLSPYDWYLALVIAGARQHRLDETYVQKMLDENKVIHDTKEDRKSKIEALQILKDTSFENVISELKY